jgi:hypothetical protein
MQGNKTGGNAGQDIVMLLEQQRVKQNRNTGETVLCDGTSESSPLRPFPNYKYTFKNTTLNLNLILIILQK